METFSGFTNLYPLSKTLRFRLIPVGETLKHFIGSGILEEDQHRAESYVKVKAIIDDYHRTILRILYQALNYLWKVRVNSILWRNIICIIIFEIKRKKFRTCHPRSELI